MATLTYLLDSKKLSTYLIIKGKRIHSGKLKNEIKKIKDILIILY